MAKTPREWRREWQWARLDLAEFIRFNRRMSAREARVVIANAVLGYAMARGWYHV